MKVNTMKYKHKHNIQKNKMGIHSKLNVHCGKALTFLFPKWGMYS